MQQIVTRYKIISEIMLILLLNIFNLCRVALSSTLLTPQTISQEGVRSNPPKPPHPENGHLTSTAVKQYIFLKMYILVKRQVNLLVVVIVTCKRVVTRVNILRNVF